MKWQIIHGQDSHSDGYLEPSQTSTMKPFCKISSRLSSRYLFLQKKLIVDVRLGSKYASVTYQTIIQTIISRYTRSVTQVQIVCISVFINFVFH